MSEVFVHDFSYALGDQIFDVEQSVGQGRTLTGAAALRDAGFVKHHVASANVSAYDLAKGAVAPIAHSTRDAGAIIYSTCLPCNGNIGSEQRFRETRDVKYLMDFPASHLQSDFGLERASVIGLNQQACTSMLGALRLGKALLKNEPDIGQILCVTADRFPEGAVYEQAYNLISDGAAACVLSTEARGYRVVACHGITNGALARASDDETVGTYFSYTHRLISELLSRAQLSMHEITWVVPQNTNITAWKILSRLLKFDCEKVFFGSIADVGHIISSDNVVNLVKLEREHAVPSGTKLLLMMAGFGLNWQAALLEKV